jgi:hypothetical protein
MNMIARLVTACFLGGVAGCALSEMPPATFTGSGLRPLVANGDQYFTIDWQPGERNGRPALTGTVTNRYGATADRVQLLVEALDDSGTVKTQQVVWLGDNVAPLDRTQFMVAVEKSPRYRVSIFAYDWRGRTGP